MIRGDPPFPFEGQSRFRWGEKWDRPRPRPRRQDAVLEAQAVVRHRLLADRRQTKRLRIFQHSPGTDDLDFPLRSDLLQSGAERCNDFFLSGPHGGQVHLRRLIAHTPLGQVPGLGHALGHMQQGL